MPKGARAAKPRLFPPRQERRGAHRVAAPDHIRCELAGQPATLQPKDISASGIAVWTDVRLPVGRDYDIAITLDTLTVSRRARVVYCKKEAGARRLVGLRFLNETDHDGKIHELIKLVATEFRAE